MTSPRAATRRTQKSYKVYKFACVILTAVRDGYDTQNRRASGRAYRFHSHTTINIVKASLYILIRLSSIRNLDLLSGSMPIDYYASGTQIDSS